MKKSTETRILNYLYCGGPKGMEDIEELFDIYSEEEICTTDDLFRDHRCFFDLIKANNAAFLDSDRQGAVLFAHRKVNSLRSMGNNWFVPGKAEGQANFSEEVKEIVGFDKKIRILEVGGGVIPYSSILLGIDGYDISSIDTFNLPAECLDRFHVKSYRQYFNEFFDVKNFDLVVGRRPCSAIRSIVNACTRDKVPYFMRLCSCMVPSETGELKDWWPILRKIDKNIVYDGEYAYNFSNSKFGTPPNLKEIIEIDDDMFM